MHKSLNAAERCECAMTGYVTLDLFSLLAEAKCKSLGLPRGSLFLAPQTLLNLQLVCLSTIVVCASKQRVGDVWARGHCRMTELGIEEWFGRLRSQSSNAQLTSRGFWRAATRQMLHESRERGPPNKCKPIVEDALTDAEFRECSVRAFKAAIELASRCSSVSSASLEQTYSEACRDGKLQMPTEFDIDEFEDENWWDEAADGTGECQEALQDVETEAQMDQQEPEDSDILAFELRNVPDADILELTAKAEPPSPQKPFHAAGLQESDLAMNTHPRTLYQALYAAPGADMWDQLWRLAMHLRHWRGGSDSHWVKNPRSARRASARLSWHQSLGMSIRACGIPIL